MVLPTSRLHECGHGNVDSVEIANRVTLWGWEEVEKRGSRTEDFSERQGDVLLTVSELQHGKDASCYAFLVSCDG